MTLKAYLFAYISGAYWYYVDCIVVEYSLVSCKALTRPIDFSAGGSFHFTDISISREPAAKQPKRAVQKLIA